MSRLLFASTVLLLTQPVLQAQVKLELAPNWAKGDKARIEVSNVSKQTLTLNGMPLKTKSDQFMIMKEECVGVAADGTRTMETSFETFQSDLQLPGGLQLNFDKGSDKNTAPVAQLEPLVKLFDALSKSKWKTEYTENGKVKSIEFEGEPFKDFSEAMKKEVSPERFRKQTEQQLKRMPERAVKKGDSWKRKETSDIGQGQKLTFEREFTYTGTKEVDGKTMDAISIKVLSVDFAIEGNPSLSASDAKLESPESSGEMLYDRDRKLVVSSTEKMQVKGSLKLGIGGMNFDSDLDLTIEAKSKVNF